ncbi:putative serine protease 42 [Drosophila biarmipes]|uniref:putative serine protease 42 n=1 Tax=Drosophila biarmipes TaxID=125945 RepID=UPI001CDACF79|nr:putative serine protease 42 [Drosophila biarmipes]
MMIAAQWIALCTLLLFHQGSGIFLERNCGVADSSVNHTPWLALIKSKANNKFICTGTLINKRYVLTTASCLNNQHELFVCLGKCDRSLENNSSEIIDGTLAHVHESYLSSSHQNDIGLLGLRTDVEYKKHIRPICIVVNPQEIWPKSKQTNLWSGIKSVPKSFDLACGGLPCKSVGNPLSIPYKSQKVQHGILSYRNDTTFAYVYTNVKVHADWIVPRALDIDIVFPK